MSNLNKNFFEYQTQEGRLTETIIIRKEGKQDIDKQGRSFSGQKVKLTGLQHYVYQLLCGDKITVNPSTGVVCADTESMSHEFLNYTEIAKKTQHISFKLNAYTLSIKYVGLQSEDVELFSDMSVKAFDETETSKSFILARLPLSTGSRQGVFALSLLGNLGMYTEVAINKISEDYPVTRSLWNVQFNPFFDICEILVAALCHVNTIPPSPLILAWILGPLASLNALASMIQCKFEVSKTWIDYISKETPLVIREVKTREARKNGTDETEDILEFPLPSGKSTIIRSQVFAAPLYVRKEPNVKPLFPLKSKYHISS